MWNAVVPADTGDLTTSVCLVERFSFALCKLLLVLATIVGDKEDSESHPGRASCYCIGTKALRAYFPAYKAHVSWLNDPLTL